MALNKIKKGSLVADAIDATKLADDAVSEEHIDVTAITGNTELSAVAADDDVLLVFDTSANAIKKIQRSNVALQAPTYSSVSPTNLLTGDGTGNFTIVVTGSRFDSTATFTLRTDGGTVIPMTSVTRNSATQLTGVVAKNASNLTNANEPFDIIITNGNGLATEGLNQININASPAFVTGAGTLGTLTGGSAMTTVDIVAADPESAGNVVFDFLTGGLPAGLSSATVHENGVSKLRITGTPTNPAATTTTSFTLRASDAASNTSTRAFSFTVSRVFTSTSFTSSGTFAVPSGVSSLSSVLVVAGGGAGPSQHAGGGGAGGVIFMPCVPVTPGGTIAVTIGCGGTGGAGTGPTGAPGGQDSVFGASPSPGLAAALTAKGGGAGGHYSPNPTGPSGGQGGSGGGAGTHEGGCAVNSSVGQGIQPTQPLNSGAYGFGNPGGTSQSPNPFRGGGGGGAGAVGQPYQPNAAGAGGVGKAYTIADGTTPVFYAGGGGGGAHNNHVGGAGSPCGTGGAGNSLTDPQPGPGQHGLPGQANKGGGGGSSSANTQPSGNGGKGVVIVRF